MIPSVIRWPFRLSKQVCVWVMGVCGLGLILYLSAEDSMSLPGPSLDIIFVNASPEVEQTGRHVIEVTAARFQNLTGERIGKVPIRVEVVDDLAAGDLSRTSSGKIQGVTVYNHSTNSGTIQISSRRSVSFGRILAHEVTHIFVREAFGRAQNQTLNEGLAEYLAAQEFPSEVKRDLRMASHGMPSSALKPYVDGFQFCQDFAEDSQFPAFFRKQIYHESSSYSELKSEWKSESASK